MKQYRLAILASHPIQYQAPLFKAIAESGEFDFTVYFTGRGNAAAEAYDPEFGRSIKWDVPLLEGYRHEFLDSKFELPRRLLLRKAPIDAVLILGWNSPEFLLAFLGYFIYAHPKWRRWLLVGGAAVVVVVTLFVSFKDAPFVKAIPGSRIFDISLSAETFQHRAIMWGIAIEGWKERPLLGWGPENYIQVFDRHFDPAYFKPAEGFGAWFDRAHSIYFDYLVETGALGFLAFIAIFVVLYRYLFRAMRRTGEEAAPPFRALPAALTFALPVAYLIQGIALFDVLPIYVNVFLFLAFMVYRMIERPLVPMAQTLNTKS